MLQKVYDKGLTRDLHMYNEGTYFFLEFIYHFVFLRLDYKNSLNYFFNPSFYSDHFFILFQYIILPSKCYDFFFPLIMFSSLVFPFFSLVFNFFFLIV